MKPSIRAHARLLLCLLAAATAGCGSTEPIPLEGTYDMRLANGQQLPFSSGPGAENLQSAVMVINPDHSFVATPTYLLETGSTYTATIKGVVTRNGDDLAYASAISPPAPAFATGHVTPGFVTYVQPSGDAFVFQRR